MDEPLSLRDLFACFAVAGIISGARNHVVVDHAAAEAYRIADKMLLERLKKPKVRTPHQ